MPIVERDWDVGVQRMWAANEWQVVFYSARGSEVLLNTKSERLAYLLKNFLQESSEAAEIVVGKK
jgi:hypothetical protein